MPILEVGVSHASLADLFRGKEVGNAAQLDLGNWSGWEYLGGFCISAPAAPPGISIALTPSLLAAIAPCMTSGGAKLDGGIVNLMGMAEQAPPFLKRRGYLGSGRSTAVRKTHKRKNH